MVVDGRPIDKDGTWDGAKSADPNSIRGLEHRAIDAKNFRVGIVAARWNAKVVDTLVEGATKALLKAGVSEHNIIVERVAGTFFLFQSFKTFQNLNRRKPAVQSL